MGYPVRQEWLINWKTSRFCKIPFFYSMREDVIISWIKIGFVKKGYFLVVLAGQKFLSSLIRLLTAEWWKGRESLLSLYWIVYESFQFQNSTLHSWLEKSDQEILERVGSFSHPILHHNEMKIFFYSSFVRWNPFSLTFPFQMDLELGLQLKGSTPPL